LKLVWFQDISARRGAGESQDLKPIDNNLDEHIDDIQPGKNCARSYAFRGMPWVLTRESALAQREKAPWTMASFTPDRMTRVTDARNAGLGAPGCSL